MPKSYPDVTWSGAASAEVQEEGRKPATSYSNTNLVRLHIDLCFSVRPLKWGGWLLFTGGNLGEWRSSPSFRGPTAPRGGNTRRNTILYDMGGGGRREPMKNVKIQVWTVLLGAEPEQKRGKLSKPGGSGQLTLRRPTNSLHVSGWICSHARLRTPARRGSWPRQSVSPGGSSACPHVAPTRCLD
jgi:hypothetical protein